MTPNEIRSKTFEKKMGGLKADEVMGYLGQVADYVEDLQAEKDEAEEKLAVLAEKLEEYREDEDSLRAALIGAQKLGDSVVRDAKKKAEMLLAEASAKAEELVADAKSNIDKEAVALARMQGQVAEFKNQILNLYRHHIELINAIPDAPELPGDVKELVKKVGAAAPEDDPATWKKADKVESFVVSYEEMEDPEDLPLVEEELSAEKESHKGHRRSSFGDLRFGEEYNLTRND